MRQIHYWNKPSTRFHLTVHSVDRDVGGDVGLINLSLFDETSYCQTSNASYCADAKQRGQVVVVEVVIVGLRQSKSASDDSVFLLICLK